MDVRRVLPVLLLCMALSAPATTLLSAQSAPRPPRSQWCLPFAIMQYAYDGDFDRALAHSEECYASHSRWADPSGNWVLDTRDPRFSERAYAGGWMLSFLCSTAQLQAMAGAITQAEATVMRAEQWHARFFGFKSFLVDQTSPSEMLAATRGFVLERAGRLQESAAAYRTGGRLGASRLAVLTLTQKDDANAATWARAAGNMPAALAVLGSLAELRGDDTTAFVMYSDSDREMKLLLEERPTNAQLPAESRPLPPAGRPAANLDHFQPMLFAERTRVVRGLTRFGQPAPSPPVQASNRVRDEQTAFNKWLQERRASTIAGIQFRPQYPRFFAGFSRADRQAIRQRKLAAPPGYDPSVVLYLPETLAVTGIIDRDTLALDFYRLTAETLSLAARAGIMPSQLLSTEPPRETTPERSVLVAELRSVLTELESLYRILQNIQLRTTGGKVQTGSDEARVYSQWTADLSTAHVDIVTSELAQSIEGATTRVRARIASAQRFAP